MPQTCIQANVNIFQQPSNNQPVIRHYHYIVAELRSSTESRAALKFSFKVSSDVTSEEFWAATNPSGKQFFNQLVPESYSVYKLKAHFGHF